VGHVDGQLAARPRGPGGLVLALNRGSEVFSVDREGPQLAFRRIATADEEAALSHAARLTVARLGARGLRARIVSERLNRRKIDLFPEPEWVSVGTEPRGVPADVVWLGGGADAFAAVLEDQIARRRRGELPTVVEDPQWTLAIARSIRCSSAHTSRS
jgi:hypothetical protein